MTNWGRTWGGGDVGEAQRCIWASLALYFNLKKYKNPTSKATSCTLSITPPHTKNMASSSHSHGAPRKVAVAVATSNKDAADAAKRDSLVWKHFEQIEKTKGTNYHAKCLVCSKQFRNMGATRARAHLAGVQGCNVAVCKGPEFDDDGEPLTDYTDEEFKQLRLAMLELHESRGEISERNGKRVEFGHVRGHAPPTAKRANYGGPTPWRASSGSSQPTIKETLEAGQCKLADQAICRFFYGNNIAFKPSESLTFREMVHEVAAAGPGYVFRGAKHLRSDGITDEKQRLMAANAEVRSTVLDDYGCTVVGDGKLDCASNALLNFLAVHAKGVEHLDTFNAADVTKKTGVFLRVLTGAYLCEDDYDPDDGEDAVQGSDDEDDDLPVMDLLKIDTKVRLNKDIHKIAAKHVVQVIFDGAAACRKALRLLKKKYPHLFTSVDTTHSLDLLLLDMGGVEWISEIVASVKELVILVKNHDAPRGALRAQTHLKLKMPADTRFKFVHTMLARVVLLKDHLIATFAAPQFRNWAADQKGDMKLQIVELRAKLNDDDWWAEIDDALAVMDPVVKMLTATDTHRAMAHTIYASMCHLSQQYEDEGDIAEKGVTSTKLASVRGLVAARWEYMHSAIHSVGALLNSILWSDPVQDWSLLQRNPEIKKEWMEALEQFFPGDLQSQQKANASLRQFWHREGIFSRPLVIQEARDIEPREFWYEYGWDHPELQLMGCRVTSQPASMTSAERNWKDHSEIHCSKRNRLLPETARDLVFVKHSLRLQEAVHVWQKESKLAAIEDSSDEDE